MYRVLVLCKGVSQKYTCHTFVELVKFLNDVVADRMQIRISTDFATRKSSILGSQVTSE